MPHWDNLCLPEMELVEARLNELNAFDNPRLPEVTGYILNQGGKRIRPLLVLLCSGIYGAELEARIDVAVAAELIHAASLLHDDVVDNSSLRRGLASANARWGNPTAVLAGDFLFARAYSLLSSYPGILSRMTEAIATMCLGELNQLYTHFDPNTSPEDYVARIIAKTASLLAASCECGAAISAMPSDERKAIGKFALHLGIAYQVLDDIADYVLDAADSGKPKGSDIKNGIVTLPLMYLLANPATKEKVHSLLQQKQPLKLSVFARELAATQAIEKTAAIAEHHLKRGIELLQTLPPCSARAQLQQLAKLFMARSRRLSEHAPGPQQSAQPGQYPCPQPGPG